MRTENRAAAEKRISARGLTYRLVRSHDEADKPWILFCTGLTLNGTCWHGWHATLADAYNLLFFDVPGYGESPISREALGERRVADWADYFLDLMEEIEAPTAFLVGEQTGGAAVLYTALKAPHRVTACTVISTPFRGGAIGTLMRDYTGEAQQGGIRAWSDFMLPLLFTGDEDSPLRDEFRQIHLANDRLHEEIARLRRDDVPRSRAEAEGRRESHGARRRWRGGDYLLKRASAAAEAGQGRGK